MNFKKLAAAVIALIMCIALAAAPALAKIASQDGLEIAFTSDKTEYEAGEQIKTSLAVTNTNEKTIYEIYLENRVPEGCELAEGTQNTLHCDALNPGESVSLISLFNVSIGNPALSPGILAGMLNNADAADNSLEIILCLLIIGVIIAVIIAVILALTLGRKKNGGSGRGNGKKFFSWLLIFAMAASIVCGLGIGKNPTAAAETAPPEEEKKQIEISETVKVAGSELALKAKIEYVPVAEPPESDVPPEAGEVSYTEPEAEHIVLDTETDDYYVDNHILLIAEDNVLKTQIENLVGEYQGEIVGYIELTNDYEIKFPQAKTLEELNSIAETLEASEYVNEAMVDYLFETSAGFVPNDSEWPPDEWCTEYADGINFRDVGGTNWGVEAIDAMGAWEHADEMQPINVGIVDSMFDDNHEDLHYERIWNNPDDIRNEPGFSTDIEAYAECSHGTHVSGTMAAQWNNNKGISGVMPKAKLYGCSLHGTDTDDVVTQNHLTGFMRWKYALTLLIVNNCRVINVSMGISTVNDGGSSYAEEIARLTNISNECGIILGNFLSKLIDAHYDFLIVQAAGNGIRVSDYNGGIDAQCTGLFAGITNEEVKKHILIVGAAEHIPPADPAHGATEYNYADFSNYGNRVDIAAPGVKIYSTVPYDEYENSHSINNRSISWDGTSMAAPHVSGVAAMCYAINPMLTASQVKEIICNTATIFIQPGIHDTTQNTYKMVNAGESVELASSFTGNAENTPSPVPNGFIMGKAYPREVHITAYSSSETGHNDSQHYGTVKTDGEGSYTLILPPGKYNIHFSKDTYIPQVVYDVEVISGECTYLPTVSMILQTAKDKFYNVQGTVRNAINNLPVEGAAVKLRCGWNNKEGEYARNQAGNVAQAITDSTGKYNIDKVKVGNYTAEISRIGYITAYSNIYVVSDISVNPPDFVISPNLPDDEYRIVLTWGEMPRDLDSHVEGTLTDGRQFHVYYPHKSDYDGNTEVCNLDVDDVTSFGPETITLHPMTDKPYYYYIHQYSDAGSLEDSGAKIKIYCGNTLLATYNVPTNQPDGRYWNVFAIVNGEIILNNTITDQPNISYVASTYDGGNGGGGGGAW